MAKYPAAQFEIRFLTWNVGSMPGKWGEISETLKRPCVDICCLQGVRCKGQCAKMTGNGFKFLWSRGYKAENGISCQLVNWKGCES